MQRLTRKINRERIWVAEKARQLGVDALVYPLDLAQVDRPRESHSRVDRTRSLLT